MEFLDHLGEHRALRVGDQVVAVTEDERVVGDADPRVAPRRERRTTVGAGRPLALHRGARRDEAGASG